jgi:hypothetical protein
MSADGSVVAGYCDLTPGSSIKFSFRWTAQTGTVPLVPGFHSFRVTACSDDGNVIVGGDKRWTAAHGLHLVPIGEPRAVAGDGWRTLGTAFAGDVWDPINGARHFDDILAQHGRPELSQWPSYSVWDISGDGRTIVGVGWPPGTTPGVDRTWMFLATIPAFCYANCDGSSVAPALNVADFTCFLRKFAQNDIYANCNNDEGMNVADFTCFLQKFAAGCP